MTYFVVSLVYYQYRKGIKLLVIFPFFFPLTLAQQDSNSTLLKRLSPTKIFFFFETQDYHSANMSLNVCCTFLSSAKYRSICSFASDRDREKLARN